MISWIQLSFAPIQIFAEALEGFAGMKRNVGVFGVGQAIEVGPEQHDGFIGHHLDRLVNPMPIVAGQSLAEPCQGLALAQPCQGSTGGLPDFRIGVAAGVLQRQ